MLFDILICLFPNFLPDPSYGGPTSVLLNVVGKKQVSPAALCTAGVARHSVTASFLLSLVARESDAVESFSLEQYCLGLRGWGGVEMH